MKCVIVYVSPNGNTRKTAQLLRDEMESDGQSLQLFDIGRGELRYNFNPVLEALQQCDLAIFGAPVYHMDMLAPMKQLFTQMEHHRGSFTCTALLFITYAGITSGKALLNSARSLSKAGVRLGGALKIAAPHFHHPSNFPDDEVRTLAKEFYHNLKKRGFPSLDARRTLELFSPEKRRVRVLYPLVHVIGKKRELPITIEQEKCKRCQKCARECPVGAITIDDGKTSLDSDTCIHCYHCTVACPLGAIHSPIEKLDTMIAKNKRIVGTEHPPHKIYA